MQHAIWAKEAYVFLSEMYGCQPTQFWWDFSDLH